MAKQLQIILEGIRATLPAEKDAIDAYAEAARRLREEAG
jgi:rubrerythrin